MGYGKLQDFDKKSKNGKAEQIKRKEVAMKLCVGDLPPTLFDADDPREPLYEHFVAYMIKSGNASSADLYTLQQLCTVISKLQMIDDAIDVVKMSGLTDKDLQNARKNYFTQYMKLIDVLGLSPQARVKMAINAQALEEKDPLEGIL